MFWSKASTFPFFYGLFLLLNSQDVYYLYYFMQRFPVYLPLTLAEKGS